MRTRILLADDHSLILQGIRVLLASRYDVVGSAEDGRALVEAALRLTPDIVLLDISMPLLNGIDAARVIKKELPATKLVFLSVHTNAIYLRKALEAGGCSYVLKSGAPDELLTAIEVASHGGTYISPGFGQEVLETVWNWPGKKTRVVIDLTSRQREILQLIAQGKQNKEIADILKVSARTVEFHRARLMTKLGAHTVADLTRFAVEEGFVDGVDNP